MRFQRIYVEIGNICNLACSFCPGTRRAPRQMTAVEFRMIMERIAPYTDTVYLHVMGEPLLHPELRSILDIARELHKKVAITTNGVLLPEASETLLAYADVIHKVSISLHAMEGNGAEAAPDSYLERAADFASAAAEKGIFAVFRLWNLDTEARRGENAENSVIEAFLHRRFPEDWVKRYSGYRIATRVFLEYAGIFTWPVESREEAEEDGYCHGLIDQLAVLCDGTVVPCCLDSEGQIALGNLFEASMEEILGSARAVSMEQGLRHGKFTEPLCRTCSYARRFRA